VPNSLIMREAGALVCTRAGGGHPVVCVPAFADSAVSWQPLLRVLADRRHHVAVVDLPGFGAASATASPATIPGYADLIARYVANEFSEPATLVGHSLGSVIAVLAAHRLGVRCRAVVSLEGNLTAEDAYFSGQAADYADPAGFKRAFAAQVRELVAADRAPASYAESVETADAECMWALGRDARARGAKGGFGQQYRRLPVPTLYLWASTTTTPATQDYLTRYRIPRHRLLIEHHWPWREAPAIVAGTLVDFIHREPQRSPRH
jgi:pimeloyl-ACP methyl ester carboxylesterase